MKRSLWPVCHVLAALSLLSAAASGQAQQALVHRAENRPLPSLERAAEIARLQAPAFQDVFYVVPNQVREDIRSVTDDAAGKAGSEAAVQLESGPNAPATVLTSFEGSTNADNGRVVGFRVAPPDTDGDVGPNHYVQMINMITTVFDKSGNPLGGGAFPSNAIWNGAGGLCQSTNRGDPIVVYDEANDRWLVSQFAFNSSSSPPFSQCVAISQTGNPLGAYNRYEFDLSAFGFNDYPKLGIVSESITMTAHLFGSTGNYVGGFVGAMQKAAMYAGQSAAMVAFNLGQRFGLVAADLDDPSGTAGFVPALFADDASGSFTLFQINVNWSNPGGASLQQLPSIGISSYDADLCTASREACVPQPSPGPSLEAMSSFLMHRLPVRDFGTHQSMVAARTVDVGSGRAGIRWWEFRKAGSSWQLYQEGTYAPADGLHRWMPSIAMNAAGDIGLGFMESSTSQFVSIGVTGQTAALSGSGTMDAAEAVCASGGGVQTGVARAGDYASTNVDPTTDRFWHTNEYFRVGGNFVWETRVCEFQVGTGVVNQAPVVTITAPADNATVNLDTPVTFSGTAIDAEDGDLSGAIAWASNRDGALGTGASLVVTSLTEGTHTITATAADGGGKTGADQITLTIVDPTPASTMEVASVVTSTQSAGKRQYRAVATVSVVDNKGNPVVGATVVGTFSGVISEAGVSNVTGSDGVAVVQSTKTSGSRTPSGFCVSGLTHAGLTWAEGDPYSCGAPPEPISVVVQSVVTGVTGNGKKKGTAAVVVVNQTTAQPVSGLTVTGDFSGTFNETNKSATTDVSGTANFTTSGSTRDAAPDVTFCVSGVTGPNVTWIPGTNDCGSAPAFAKQAPTEQADGFELAQNYPNPFNPTTVIAFSIPRQGHVSLRVFNAMGQEVATLADREMEPGAHRVTFDASALSAGLYVYTIRSGQYVETRRMTLLK